MLENMKVYIMESNGVSYEFKINMISSLVFADENKRGYLVGFQKKDNPKLKFLLEDWQYNKICFHECVLMEKDRKLRKLYSFYKCGKEYRMSFKDLVK